MLSHHGNCLELNEQTTVQFVGPFNKIKTAKGLVHKLTLCNDRNQQQPGRRAGSNEKPEELLERAADSLTGPLSCPHCQSAGWKKPAAFTLLCEKSADCFEIFPVIKKSRRVKVLETADSVIYRTVFENTAHCKAADFQANQLASGCFTSLIAAHNTEWHHMNKAHENCC